MNEAEKRRVKMIENVERDIYLLYMKSPLCSLQDFRNITITNKLSCSLKYSKRHVVILL